MCLNEADLGILRTLYKLNSQLSIMLRFEVIISASIKISVIWVMTLCSLIDRYQHFGRTCYFLVSRRQIQNNLPLSSGSKRDSSLKREAAGSSQALVSNLSAKPHVICQKTVLILSTVLSSTYTCCLIPAFSFYCM
jgi:hypothetical protein